MKKKIFALVAVMMVATVFLSACGAKAPEGETTAVKQELDSPFPLTDDAKDLMKTSDTQINYKTAMTTQEVADFYRGKFTEKGLTERTLVTVVEETTVNLVFDEAEGGKSTVVQVVQLDEATRNVNVRMEEGI